MDADVNPPRPAARQARTRRTRAAVINAARHLFSTRGYAATTVEAISEVADTPQATIYRLFSSKLGILKAVLDVSIAGDDQPVAVSDRPEVRSFLTEVDPSRLLAGFVELLRVLMARAAPVHRILTEAARTEPEAAALLAENVRQRQQGQAQVARALAEAQALRPELTERDAADIIHVLASPEVYRLLVDDRSWSDERYEAWILATLVEQLLPPAR